MKEKKREKKKKKKKKFVIHDYLCLSRKLQLDPETLITFLKTSI